jgi:rfaE bifunctional protein kinase chain/domain
MLELCEVLNSWAGKRVLVVGDIMADVDLHTKFTRFSSEFEGKIYEEKEEIRHPGGAANVAQICASLGASVELMGPIGTDQDGIRLWSQFHEIDRLRYVAFLGAPQWKETTVKTRLFQDKLFVCRLDRDVINPFPIEQFQRKLHPEILPYDALLLSDYQKGCFPSAAVAQEFVNAFRQHSPKGFVGFNPKPQSIPAYPKGFDLISMNDLEYRRIDQRGDPGSVVARRCGVRYLLHTQGSRGLELHSAENGSFRAVVREVAKPDVVGCGDATFAAAVLAALTTEDPGQIASIASAAGTAKAAKSGTVPITCEEIYRLLTSEKWVHA